MKQIFTLLSFVLLMFSFQDMNACDRSELNLDTLTFDGTNYTIHLEFCIGGGVVGSTRGADNWTGTFAFAVFGDSGMTMVGFSPPSFTSDTTNCTNDSVTFSGPFGANFGVAYISPGCFYSCVSSTALCGRPHTDCSQFIITVSEVPDSIRVFGFEGTGNPVAGCYPNPDMLVDFTIMPVVWSHTHAIAMEDHIEIQWGTHQEINNNFFQVMRANPIGGWSEIGRVDAIGQSTDLETYSFNDNSPFQGPNLYKVVQVDLDGQRSESDVVTVDFNTATSLQWKYCVPSPAHDQLSISFLSGREGPVQFQLINSSGAKVWDKSVQAFSGSNELEIDMRSLPTGMYFLRLKGPRQTLYKKIIKT